VPTARLAPTAIASALEGSTILFSSGDTGPVPVDWRAYTQNVAMQQNNCDK
jgi:hypothetical protein